MSWVKVDDQMPRHPKLLGLGKDRLMCLGLWMEAAAYAAHYLTDGMVPKDALPPGTRKFATRLVDAGLWYDEGASYRIHDWSEYQPSREEVLANRQMRSVRKDIYADPFVTKRVKDRDEGRCRYCGIIVRWMDRRSAGGGTFDHVVPNGGNSDDNIVVACRGCNSKKGRRTPEEAGMALIPLGKNQIGSSSEPNPIRTPVPVPVPSSPVPEYVQTYIDPAQLYFERVGRRPGAKERAWIEDLQARFSTSEVVRGMQAVEKGSGFLARLDALMEGRAA